MRISTCVWSWELDRRTCAGASLGGWDSLLPRVRYVAVRGPTREPARREAFDLRLMQIRSLHLWRCRECPMAYQAPAARLRIAATCACAQPARDNGAPRCQRPSLPVRRVVGVAGSRLLHGYIGEPDAGSQHLTTPFGGGGPLEW